MKNEDIKPESLSRIYNEIANLKKKDKIDVKEKNEFQIPCWKTNDYNFLYPEEME